MPAVMKNNILKYTGLVAIVLLILLVTNSIKIFDYPPSSVHQWRQSDCAAYVKTFYRTGHNLWNPATYNLAGKEGKVISEFPIIYYISAQIEHICGEHYWVVRGLTFLCYLIGLMALLAIANRWIKNPILLFLPILLFATSPYYYYYALNFLPNVPAISFSLVGLYLYLLYIDKRKNSLLFSGTLFFILSTALKPTDGGLIWLACIACVLFPFYKNESKRYSSIKGPISIAAIIIAGCIFAWAKYVTWYNDQNGNHQNLIGIYPIWDMDPGLIKYTFKRVLTEWSNVFQQKLILAFLSLSLIIYVWKWKQLDFFLKWFTFWLITGVCAYSILWFKAYTDHDYYQLPLTLPALFLSITIISFIETEWLKNLPKSGIVITNIIGLALIAISIFHNRNIQNERYTNPDYVYINPAMFELEPYLKTIGVQTKDAVVCVPDKSPNISLNAINHYGYSEEFNSEAYNIKTFKAQGAAYLIISDSSYLQNPVYLPFLSKPVGRFKGITIFDIRN